MLPVHQAAGRLGSARPAFHLYNSLMANSATAQRCARRAAAGRGNSNGSRARGTAVSGQLCAYYATYARAYSSRLAPPGGTR